MRGGRPFLTAAVVAFCATNAARADMHYGRAPELGSIAIATCPSTTTSGASYATQLEHPYCLDLTSPVCLARGDSALPAQSNGDGLDAGGEVRDLPPLPGSATLFLAAMVSMGGWHLVRSARDLHWGALPEWYHTGGPIQIGHAVPLDLDFHSVPPCWFESAAEGGGDDRAFLNRLSRGDGPRCYAQVFFLAIAAPRGPPTCC